MHFHYETLDNGLPIVAEINPRAVSTAIGFYVRTGARDETPEISGVSHFLEHMAFKGNETYSADDVNRIFDEVGAKYNASTSEEVTLFYAAVLPEYVDRTFDLLSALIFPSLRNEDFETEKQVILEEIGMYDDMPAFVAHEHAMRAHFGTHPLGQSILGPAERIRGLSADQMRAYHRTRYCAPNITLVAAGQIDAAHLRELADRHCGHWPTGTADRDTAEAHPAGGQETVTRSGTLQQHITLMSAAPPATSELRFAADLLAVIVGDTQGSRLYWELVDPGHAEAAEISYNDYDGSGAWTSYVCCRPEQAEDNLRRVRSMYERLTSEGVTAEELQQAQNKVASRIVLQSERPIGRLSSLGGNWLYRHEYRSVQDDLAALRGVTREQISGVLRQYPLAPTTVVGVGPLDALEQN
jgi:predicted Zn-dependent peptidase